MSKTNFEVYMKHMKVPVKKFSELWSIFSRVPMGNCTWCYLRQQFLSFALRKCIKYCNIVKVILVQGFCPIKNWKLLDFPSCSLALTEGQRSITKTNPRGCQNVANNSLPPVGLWVHPKGTSLKYCSFSIRVIRGVKAAESTYNLTVTVYKTSDNRVTFLIFPKQQTEHILTDKINSVVISVLRDRNWVENFAPKRRFFRESWESLF